jgi:formylglycine-generating enzyme required for sulfatase activity/nitrate/TMAO reductase-like tetraheme cytochrome c subunit
MIKKERKIKRHVLFLSGILICIILFFAGNKAVLLTSTDKYCQSCHIHPQADLSWKRSTHFFNKSGVRVHCVECHLPPKEQGKYLIKKARTGLKDLYGYYFKDSASFNWESKKLLSHAVKIVFNESCVKCHQNLFTTELTPDGETAHFYYENNAGKLNLQCINCHLDAGHYNPNYIHGQMTGIPRVSTSAKELFTGPAIVTSFENYTEQIPGTAVSFSMIAVKGGTFKMGSPDNEPFHKEEEGPLRNVTVSPFFMAETEVSWDEYWTFFAATNSEGRSDPYEQMEHNANNPDAISGPTPPYGNPDQNWGSGERPAITMTHYAAGIYCQWLSKMTGKKYRLPTEAEWEFACRAGSETPYFFTGDPRRLSENGLRNKIFGTDTTQINRYVVYSLNSPDKTQEPSFVKPNPFGFKNLPGNVLEFCSDWYTGDVYSKTGLSVIDPKGPEEGEEHVVRGGDFSFDAKDLRSAGRGYTQTDEWLKTDPQQPKSIWWYSDIFSIGFRVVCEPDSTIVSD